MQWGGGGNPTGTIISYFGESAPSGYLICDGEIYDKSAYSALAEHLLSLTNNTAYIVSDDETKFKVPDLRGEFLRGTGTNSHTNQGSGATVGVHQDSSIIPYILPHNTSLYISKGDFYNPDSSYGSAVMHESYQSKNTGSSQPIGKMIRPTNTSVLYCIKT